ncbi:hypothetical protein J7643_05080 [bacterium]|nr:hypothetical protein [bacterium]
MAERKGHETRDVNARAVGRVAFWFTVCFGLIGLALLALFWHDVQVQMQRKGPIVPLKPAEPRFPAPGVRRESGETLARFRESEEQLLNGYGWVDRTTGTIRIPIDRAMELVASRGLPVRAEHER